MLENLRRKSLVKTYNDLMHQVHFEQGHAVYLDSFSIAQHKQKLSKKKIEASFQNTINFITTVSFKIPCIVNKVKFNMIFCPSGTFIMGHNDQEKNQPREETIERPFLLGETEITQELYEKVMGKNPSNFQNGSQNPVERVSWVDAILFCNELSRLQGLELCYSKKQDSLDSYGWDCDFGKNGYRLPEEKEWEYAAKASTQNRWAGTNDESKLAEYAWFKGKSAINEELQTHPVKTKKPNEWGFYDMSGNVWEWCWDVPLDYPYPTYRVTRGGACNRQAWYSRSDTLESATIYLDQAVNSCRGIRVCRSIVS